MKENHRVIEAVGRYLVRWEAKVGVLQVGKEIVKAYCTLPTPLAAQQVVEEFNGIPGPVNVVCIIVNNPTTVVFSWLTQRG
jgi:hypothetical protein